MPANNELTIKQSQTKKYKQILNTSTNKPNNTQLLGVVNCQKCRKPQPNTEWYIINLCTNSKCYLQNITKYVRNWFFCEPCYGLAKHQARCFKCNTLKSQTWFLGGWVFPQPKVSKCPNPFF